jgi:hypothetical protein
VRSWNLDAACAQTQKNLITEYALHHLSEKGKHLAGLLKNISTAGDGNTRSCLGLARVITKPDIKYPRKAETSDGKAYSLYRGAKALMKPRLI